MAVLVFGNLETRQPFQNLLLWRSFLFSKIRRMFFDSSLRNQRNDAGELVCTRITETIFFSFLGEEIEWKKSETDRISRCCYQLSCFVESSLLFELAQPFFHRRISFYGLFHWFFFNSLSPSIKLWWRFLPDSLKSFMFRSQLPSLLRLQFVKMKLSWFDIRKVAFYIEQIVIFFVLI